MNSELLVRRTGMIHCQRPLGGGFVRSFSGTRKVRGWLEVVSYQVQRHEWKSNALYPRKSPFDKQEYSKLYSENRKRSDQGGEESIKSLPVVALRRSTAAVDGIAAAGGHGRSHRGGRHDRDGWVR